MACTVGGPDIIISLVHIKEDIMQNYIKLEP